MDEQLIHKSKIIKKIIFYNIIHFTQKKEQANTFQSINAHKQRG